MHTPNLTPPPLPVDTLSDSDSHDTLHDDDMDMEDYSQDGSDVEMDSIFQEDRGADNMADFRHSESPEFWLSMGVLDFKTL